MKEKALTVNRFVLGILVLWISGCAAHSRLEPLEITLSDLEVEEMTLMETSLVAKVRIVNPNPESLNFSGASCKLYLEGGKVGRGVSSESFSIDRLSTETIHISFFINNVAAIYRLRQLQEKDAITYKMKTVLFSDGPYGTKRIQNVYEGVLDLNENGTQSTVPSNPS